MFKCGHVAQVVDAVLIKNKQTGEPRGFGFVEFKDGAVAIQGPKLSQWTKERPAVFDACWVTRTYTQTHWHKHSCCPVLPAEMLRPPANTSTWQESHTEWSHCGFEAGSSKRRSLTH